MNSLLFFVIAIAILVVVHEFGHFWVAKRCGVKVLTFSVGFGKKLWSRQGKDGTEYVLAAIPLGGYVKMLDEREGEVTVDELDRAFNRKSLKARIAIVLAGPMANLVFAVFAYWLIFILGTPGIKPIVDTVSEHSPAESVQIQKGDEIIAINGFTTSTVASVYKRLGEIKKEHNIVITTSRNNVETQHSVNLTLFENSNIDEQDVLQQLGIKTVQPKIKPVVGEVMTGSPAEQAGLIKGDELLSHDGQLIDDWSQWVTLIRTSVNIPLTIEVKRQDRVVSLSIQPELSEDGNVRIGAAVDPTMMEIDNVLKATQQYSIVDSFGMALVKTWDFSSSTVKSIAGMLMGRVSADNIGGPISIAQFAGKSAEYGVIAFISFLAMISISLGILNLLPIPVLDGGHLVFYVLEGIRGKPLAEQSQLKAQKIGMFLLMMLMIIAFSNDLSRLFG
jgi:regulator of sigma E protease